MMSGEQESSQEPKLNFAETEAAKLNSFLDTHVENLGLGKLTDSPVNQYLKLTSSDLRGMSPEACFEAAYLLNQEALFLQNEINKQQAQLDFAKARLAKTIAPVLNNYGGKYCSFETRQMLAIRENSYAQQLQTIIHKSERIIARLNYLPSQLRNLAQVLTDYMKTKARANNEAARTA